LDVKYYSLHSEHPVLQKNGVCEDGEKKGQACATMMIAELMAHVKQLYLEIHGLAGVVFVWTET
jgi:hypothetical protein